jgi:predicted lipoprotein with Yx(FWY)xxD motif
MEQADRHQTSVRRHSVRGAALALAVGGLSSSIIFANPASAAFHKKAKVVVSTAKSAQFGTILVSGKTLYTYVPSKTACGSKCQKVWPELLLPKGVTAAKAGSGVNASQLGAVKRRGGVRQVTYAGKPLYYFSLDKAPGQVKGNISDVWGKWSVVMMTQPAIATIPPTSTTSTVKTPTPAVGTTPTTSRTPGTSPPTTTPAPTTTPTTQPPPPTTTTTSSPPTTTTTAPGGGGVSF